MKALQQDWVAKWAIYSPDKIALKEYETGKTMTYSALNRLAMPQRIFYKKPIIFKKATA